MNGFKDNGDGSKSFTHEGWTVKVGVRYDASAVEVTAPGQEAGGAVIQIEVGDNGVWVHGASPGLDHDDHRAEAVTIPWPVIRALIAARAMTM